MRLLALLTVTLSLQACKNDTSFSSDRTPAPVDTSQAKIEPSVDPNQESQPPEELISTSAKALLNLIDLAAKVCDAGHAGVLYYVISEEQFYHCSPSSFIFEPIDLRGSEGAQGAMGASGAAGVAGIQGAKGVQGEQGLKGEAGDAGAAAPDPGFNALIINRTATSQECAVLPNQSTVQMVGLDNGDGEGEPRDNILHADEVDNSTYFCLSTNAPLSIEESNPSIGLGPNHITYHQGALYFAAYDASNGNELWKFDGTTASLVQDINPNGTDNSDPQSLLSTSLGLFFSANDGTNGAELWRLVNGQASMVHDIQSGAGGSSISPGSLIEISGVLYFIATDTDNYGVEVWKYDGTTAEVIDINSGTGDGSPSGLSEFNGELYFIATNGVDGRQVYKYDGSSATAITSSAEGGPTNPFYLASIAGALYFQADGGAGIGVEPYTYDGTSVSLLGNLNPGDGSSDPQAFAEHAGEAYFLANDGTHGYELWRSGGGTPRMIADINPGAGFGVPRGLTDYKGDLYFSATDGVNGRALWKYDGSDATLVADIHSSTDDYFYDPEELTVFAGALYFQAEHQTSGQEIWKHDGVETTIVADIDPTNSFANGDGMTVFANGLYFRANDSVNGNHLWKIESNLDISQQQ